MGRNSWMQTPAGDEIMDGKFHAADGLAIVFNPSFPYRLVRSVAFDFRVKARDAHKAAWNHLFAAGSLVTALAQGWILGAYVTGCHTDLWSRLLAAGIALTLPAAYAMLGVGWLLMKTEGICSARPCAGVRACCGPWALHSWASRWPHRW